MDRTVAGCPTRWLNGGDATVLRCGTEQGMLRARAEAVAHLGGAGVYLEQPERRETTVAVDGEERGPRWPSTVKVEPEQLPLTCEQKWVSSRRSRVLANA